MRKQALNPQLAFARILVREERPSFVRRRQHANGVERRTPEKLGVRARLAREQAEFAELRPREVVDEIISRQRGVTLLRQQPIRRDGDARRINESHVARDHRAFAAELADAHDPRFVHGSDLLVARRVIRERGHIASRVIRVMSRDPQRLLCAFLVALLARLDVHADQCRLVRVLINHPAANPPQQRLVRRRAGFDALTAAVLDRQRGFEQQQAFVRCCGEHAPPASFLHNLGKVGFQVVVKDRQLEAVLPISLGVARARRATGPGQQRHHVTHEGRR